MPRLPRLAIALAVLVLVAACQVSSPGKGADAVDPSDVTANAITGDKIEVTPLDDTATAEAQTRPAPVDRPRESEVATSQADPEASDPEVSAPAPVPAEEEAAPEAEKSEAQRACEKKNGRWTAVGNTALRTCVKVTRDNGKQCNRASQCESTCLARSGTCAPFKPLLGCNEIFQDDGARVTLCIE